MNRSVLSAGRTDIGRVRRRNEDAILLRDERGLWVIADGMGGHSAGDYASRMIVERLGALSLPEEGRSLAGSIERALQQVNLDLAEAAQQRGADLIGSTVVVLVRDSDSMLCGWVGDSRCYCFEDRRLSLITRDHAIGGDHASAGSGMLTRAVGSRKALQVDWVVAPNRPGVQFLLCSDGINKELTDAELEAGFHHGQSPQDLLDRLFELALSRGARDNISAIVLHLQE